MNICCNQSNVDANHYLVELQTVLKTLVFSMFYSKHRSCTWAKARRIQRQSRIHSLQITIERLWLQGPFEPFSRVWRPCTVQSHLHNCIATAVAELVRIWNQSCPGEVTTTELENCTKKMGALHGWKFQHPSVFSISMWVQGFQIGMA